MRNQKQNIGPSPLVSEAVRLLNVGQFAAASEVLRRALAIKPTDADALGLLGIAEAQLGRLDQAIPLLRRVVELRPSSHDAHFNLARGLQQARDIDGAEKHYREALRLKPNTASYYNNLGTLYQDRNDHQKARESFEKALQCDPRLETAVGNLCTAYRVLGDMAALEQLSARMIQARPNDPAGWLYRAQALFFLGRFSEAWDCYAWRFKAPTNPAVPRTVPGLRDWQGEDLGDKSVLVWTEQGPGDEVMYASMIPDIQKRVKRLGILCTARLAPLFKRSFPGVEVYADTAPEADAKTFDVQAGLVSFAKILRPDGDSFGGAASYLKADPDKAAALRATYRGDGNPVLIGIAWRSTGVDEAAQKTVNLGAWGALFALPGVRFVNLQYGDCSRELAAVKSEYKADVLSDPTIDPLRDLDAYAAQVAAMDVVVCSSNTAAHFAGALGVDTHVMLPATIGLGRRWYWFERNGRSAWYPSVKLHVQSQPNAWLEVVRDVTLDLARQIHARGLAHETFVFLASLANAYRQGGQMESVVEVLRAIATLPGHEFDALLELAQLVKSQKQSAAAEAYLDQALQHDPQSYPALNLRGVLCAERGDYQAAEVFYRRALAVNPDGGEVYNNLGTAVRRQGRGIEAQEHYLKAQTLMPDNESVLLNLGINAVEISRPDEALPYLDRLLQLKPGFAEAHHGRGLALLAAGRFAEGWPEMWWQHFINNTAECLDETRLPRWQGQNLDGKKVLVWTEQGPGDEIMAVSMMPDLMATPAIITLACSIRMVPLFRRSFPGARVIPHEELKTINLSKFDYQMSVSELGAATRPAIEAFPSRRQFLMPDAGKTSRLRQRYRQGGAKRVIGLSWASVNPELGGLKGLRLANIVLAAGVPAAAASGEVKLVSLQYGDHAPEIAATKQLTNWDVFQDPEVDAIKDLDAFAAQVAAMDAVVTISNTTAHMAGALGVPTFLLLPYNRGRHWYWLRAYDYCPWYPSVRYFVQSTSGTWDAALQACHEEISRMA